MRTYRPHIIALTLGLLWLTGCSRREERKTDWQVTLDKEQTQPYGTHLAWRSLPWYFPAAKREALNRMYRYTSMDEQMSYHGDSVALLVMVGLNYFVSEAEWNSILSFAQAGNEVLLLAARLDDKVEKALHCQKQLGGNEEYPLNEYNDGSNNRGILRLLPDTLRSYGYTGRSLQGYFSLDTAAATAAADTVQSEDSYFAATEETASDDNDGYENMKPEILGFNPHGPDFIRYDVGDGHITLHAAPLVLSNYFLLQDGNRAYLDRLWHSFPANVSHIYWNEYYKRSPRGSHFGILWEYPATRWALIIALATLAVYVLLGLKRRQRIVPVIPPVENASVSFVETVGRLYFNKGNHANLAEKMIQHFLEWVRTTWHLDTNQLNPAFVRQLAAKTGQPEARVEDLVQRIHEVRLGGTEVTPDYLYDLHRLLQSFYNNYRS